MNATKNAPTTKIAKYIDEGMEVSYGHPQDSYTAYAKESYDNDGCHEGYSIELQKEMLPPFKTMRFETLQELANAMRDLSSLRNWRKLEWEY